MPYDATPTLEMPMPGGAMQMRLIKALEEHPSLYQLTREFPHLAAQLESNALLQGANFSVMRTVKALRDDEKSRELTWLTHSIPRSCLRSIILGTVAYDVEQGENQWYKPPGEFDEKMAGVYVVGLERTCFNGKFLSSLEIDVVVQKIDEYIEGANVLSIQGDPLKWTSVDKDRVRWVDKVDQQFRPIHLSAETRFREAARDRAAGNSANWPVAYFMEQLTTSTMVQIIRSLKRRQRVTPQDDAERMVRQKQSPLYVGCSTNLRSRMAIYKHATHLQNANKPLTFLYNLLWAAGYSVSAVSKIAARTWKREQLPLAEMLVATLAGSLLPLTGFNAVEAGGNTFAPSEYPSALATKAAEEATLASSHMAAEVETTLDETARILAFEHELHQLELSVDQVVDKNHELGRRVGRLHAAAQQKQVNPTGVALTREQRAKAEFAVMQRGHKRMLVVHEMAGRRYGCAVGRSQ